MKVLFLTLLGFDSLQENNIYTDLLREFVKNGHEVYVISPIEKREGKTTYLIEEDNAIILRLQIGNIQKTNIIEKGVSTVTLEQKFKKAVERYFSDVKFDLLLYSTPPITLTSTIEYVKKRDGSRSYLLLKDIFPQNAVDIGMMSKRGVKGVMYKHFRKKEKQLYKVSDWIGCMSQANVDYVIQHNPEINTKNVEICPNSIEAIDKKVDEKTSRVIREKYDIPLEKTVFVYGGNLGKPQGIPFIIDCLKECSNVEEAYFLIIGDGTEYEVLEKHINSGEKRNAKLMKRLPKEDYDTLVGACDVGLIFLDHRFTIPNFPSRILSYMQASIPVFAITDSNTDIGKVIADGEFGWWCESNNLMGCKNIIDSIVKSNDLAKKGKNAFSYLIKYFDVANAYKTIEQHI